MRISFVCLFDVFVVHHDRCVNASRVTHSVSRSVPPLLSRSLSLCRSVVPFLPCQYMQIKFVFRTFQSGSALYASSLSSADDCSAGTRIRTILHPPIHGKMLVARALCALFCTPALYRPRPDSRRFAACRLRSARCESCHVHLSLPFSDFYLGRAVA